jgi:anionic cell wall polymer biosynthesis LytR-Cps2A-Psr (LCP) family protein
MVKTVEQLLGVNVHYYVETNFQGFVRCIDILGGIDYNVERRMLFEEEGINLHPGPQILDGDKALQYVRWRGDPTADIGRVERQQRFVKAFLDQHMTLGTITRIPSLLNALREHVITDMSTAQMLNLAARFTDVGNLSFSSSTLPGDARTIGGAAYWVMDTVAADDLIRSIYNPFAADPYNPLAVGNN